MVKKHDGAELARSPKGNSWKVAIARLLRKLNLTPNRWIAERLNTERKYSETLG
jgi:hypothetical protein